MITKITKVGFFRQSYLQAIVSCALIITFFLQSTPCHSKAVAPTNETSSKRSFETSDGVKLWADIYSSRAVSTSTKKASGTILLLPMLGKSRQTYQPLIGPLLAQGFHVIALDLRGQGESVELADKTSHSNKVSYQAFDVTDWAKLPADVLKVIDDIQTFSRLDSRQVALVGASIGANTAAIAGTHDKKVKAMVLLSPGLDYHELRPAKSLKVFARPCLIVAAKDDDYSLQSGKELAKLDTKNIKLELYNSGGHGTEMFKSHPELASTIANWLSSKLTN